VTAVAVLAGKAAPGATTVAVALTLSWPGPVILVDADPAGGDVMAGLLPGRASTESGLLSWSVAGRHLPAMEATAAMAHHALALPEAGDAWVMPGLQSAAQAGALTGDVVVDAGRLGEGSCWPVIAACDVVLLVVRPTARAVQGSRAAAELLRRRLGDLDAVRLVVNGAGPYSASDVAAALEIEHAHVTPADPRASAALVDGSVATARGLTRSRLVRAAGRIAEQVARLQDSTAAVS